jgi:hypothetical protein
MDKTEKKLIAAMVLNIMALVMSVTALLIKLIG